MQKQQQQADHGGYIRVERDSTNAAIAVMKMDNKTNLNRLDKDLMTEIISTLETLEEDSSCRGVILTSTIPGVFCSGLDISEMYQKSPDDVGNFWRLLQELWIKLYSTRLVTIGAINGHALAGGCLVAMSCDYRIMAKGEFLTGLNEVRVGIIAPVWFQDLMEDICGKREADLALQLGTLYKSDEALRVTLVDEIASLEEVMSKAREQMEKWLKIPDHARVATKQIRRKRLVDKLRAVQEEDIEFTKNFIGKESIQKSIGKILEIQKSKTFSFS